MHERHPLRGLLKPNEEAEELAERFNNMADEDMQELLDRISNRLEEMLDEAASAEQFEIMKPGFITEYTEEICEMALRSDISDANLHLFFDMLHLDMEDRIQEHEMGVAENEDANLDFLRPEQVKTLMLVKIRAFGSMIKQTKEKTFEQYHSRKKSADPATSKPKDTVDVQMKEEEIKASQQPGEESKDAGAASHAKTRIEFV